MRSWPGGDPRGRRSVRGARELRRRHQPQWLCPAGARRLVRPAASLGRMHGGPRPAAEDTASGCPGASFGGGDPPVVAEPRSAAAVPHPRDPSECPDPADPPTAAERPGTGEGHRPSSSASASVPMASRVIPPVDAEELPPPQCEPLSRVNGRRRPPTRRRPHRRSAVPGREAAGQRRVRRGAQLGCPRPCCAHLGWPRPRAHVRRLAAQRPRRAPTASRTA